MMATGVDPDAGNFRRGLGRLVTWRGKPQKRHRMTPLGSRNRRKSAFSLYLKGLPVLLMSTASGGAYGVRPQWEGVLGSFLMLTVFLYVFNPVLAVSPLWGNPCNDRWAYCYTDSQGNRFCGYPGQSSYWCGRTQPPPSNSNSCWNNPNYVRCNMDCQNDIRYLTNWEKMFCIKTCQWFYHCNS